MKEKLSRKNSRFRIGRDNLGSQLSQVANLLDAGVNIPVFKVSIGSFDTHIDQFWKHRNLLRELSEGIFDFTQALKQMGYGIIQLL